MIDWMKISDEWGFNEEIPLNFYNRKKKSHAHLNMISREKTKENSKRRTNNAIRQQWLRATHESYLEFFSNQKLISLNHNIIQSIQMNNELSHELFAVNDDNVGDDDKNKYAWVIKRKTQIEWKHFKWKSGLRSVWFK